jgi:hypothetical protein
LNSDDASLVTRVIGTMIVLLAFGAAVGWAVGWFGANASSAAGPSVPPDADTSGDDVHAGSADASSDAPNPYAAQVACKRAVFEALPSSSGAQFPSIYAPNAVDCEGNLCTLDAHVETGLGERDFHCEVERTPSGWKRREVVFR